MLQPKVVILKAGSRGWGDFPETRVEHSDVRKVESVWTRLERRMITFPWSASYTYPHTWPLLVPTKVTCWRAKRKAGKTFKWAWLWGQNHTGTVSTQDWRGGDLQASTWWRVVDCFCYLIRELSWTMTKAGGLKRSQTRMDKLKLYFLIW